MKQWRSDGWRKWRRKDGLRLYEEVNLGSRDEARHTENSDQRLSKKRWLVDERCDNRRGTNDRVFLTV